MKLATDIQLVDATIGGIGLGLSCTLLMYFSGKITGISGITEKALVPTAVSHTSSDKGHVKRMDKEGYWTWSYIGGLCTGGYALTMFYPAAFGQHSPTAYQLAPAGAAVAGALVGFGTRVGCGCTSGHGLCGLSRRSMRSLSAVVTFMFSGGVTVYLTRTYAVSSEALSWMFQNVSAASVGSSGFMADTAGGVVDLNSLLKAAALLFGSAYVSRKMILSSSGQAHNSIAGINATLNSNSRKVGYDIVNTPSLTTHFVSFGCGALFALCLGYSGMTDPQRVSAFLDVTSPSGWDPSLMGVMGGGVLVNLLTFEFMRKDEKTKMSKYAFGLDPRNMGLDGRLLSGAAIFGMGWGIGGMCPGPALASIFDFSGPALYFLPAMLLGMGCSALV